MKTFIKHFGTFPCSAIFSALMLTPGVCFSHNEYVHEQITYSAFCSSANLAAFLADNSVPQNLEASPSAISYGGTATPSVWLQYGSYYEDMEDIFNRRCLDHFYTVQPQRIPGKVFGLTDWSEPIVVAYLVPAIGSISGSTKNSFIWGTQNGVCGPLGLGYNVYKWSDARTNELAALTNATPDARNTSMAMMFYSLGHVLHLNQDTSSPDHVRDAAHLLTAWFENYGRDHWPNNPQWFVMPQNVNGSVPSIVVL